ncbi:hypothetical protein DESA109040_05770 [Deinococcus saxicola]|uniref:hypothetical protein n=1 Tax=Deinococcus saxicola TaxID=249406 RepID=UPI0039F02D5A
MTNPYKPLDLITACLNPPGKDRPHADKSGEYLLFKRNGPVKGLQVQHRVKHSHGEDTFGLFCGIASEPSAYITEVLMLNGVGTNHEDGARLVLYTGSQRFLLNNSGERIRVVDSRGTVLAAFDVPANTCGALPAAPSKIIIPAAGVAAASAFGQVR